MNPRICFSIQKAKLFLVLSGLPFSYDLKSRRFFHTKKEAAQYVSYLHTVYKGRIITHPAPLAWGLLAWSSATPSLSQARPKWLLGSVIPESSSASVGSLVSTKAFFLPQYSAWGIPYLFIHYSRQMKRR
jgi:hypothetical protein